jgi:hypothetical protein
MDEAALAVPLPAQAGRNAGQQMVGQHLVTLAWLVSFAAASVGLWDVVVLKAKPSPASKKQGLTSRLYTSSQS